MIYQYKAFYRLSGVSRTGSRLSVELGGWRWNRGVAGGNVAAPGAPTWRALSASLRRTENSISVMETTFRSYYQGAEQTQEQSHPANILQYAIQDIRCLQQRMLVQLPAMPVQGNDIGIRCWRHLLSCMAHGSMTAEWLCFWVCSGLWQRTRSWLSSLFH